MGPVLVLVSAACFGAMAVFAKLAYAAGVSSDALLLLRFTLAAVVLAWSWWCGRSCGPTGPLQCHRRGRYGSAGGSC